MCDQGNIMEFVRNEEEDSNSDYGSLSPISSPGTLSWIEHAWSEITQGLQIERPIDFYSPIPIPVPASPTNYMDTWSSFNTHFSFPEFSADFRLPISIGYVSSLKRLNLSFCPRPPKLPEWWSHQNISLRVLTIHNCKNLPEHSGWIQNTSTLRVLRIQNCENLTELPDWIQNISSLEVLEIQNCQKLTELPDWIQNISSLERLEIRNCQKLTELPDSIRNLSSLERLEIYSSEYSSNLSRVWFPAATTDRLEYPTHPIFETNDSKRQSSLSTIVQSSSHGRQMLPDSVQTFEHSKNASRKSLEVIAHTQTNNQHKRKKSTTTWSEYGWIRLPDLERLYGKKRAEAAGILKVSVSTFKRTCRELGIPRWPSAKRKREKPVISAQKCNVPLRVADEEQASTPQSPNAFPSALPPFSSSSTAIETHPESSPCPSLSKHREGNPSHDHNIGGNNKTTEENDISQGRVLAEESRQSKARNGSLSVESLLPDAPLKTSQPPQNGITCEDSETSSMSRQKRKRLEKETDCMNEVIRFEDQPSEIQNGNPKTQATGFASEGSSYLGSITGSIEGNKGYNRNSKSITGYGIVDDMDSACTGVQLIVDDMDSTCMGVQSKDDTSSTRMEVQPPLESMSTLLLNLFSCSENTAQNIKLHFDNLIALPLKDLIDPGNESSMKKALSILADNLSLFSEEQAEQILGLSFDFPGLVNSWKEYSQSQIYSQKSSAETDKIRELVETSMNDEEHLKVRFEVLKINEKELMAQLEAVQKEKASIAEQMHEKCKQTKYLVSLAEEKAASRTKEKHMMKLATTKLNNLVDQWARIQSFFM